MPRFRPCTIGDGRARAAAECADLAVPLDPDDPEGETLTLALARLPARRAVAGTAPFTMIAGGPGQSAIESWPMLAHAFRHIARDRDVILIDQRGTGGSARLDCPEAPPSADGRVTLDLEHVRTETGDCLRELPRDPRWFTTSVAVRDLERVRERLGIERWNLYGVSYGTRVAQHYARRYPERVRTMILDAVLPPDLPLGPDIAPFAARALELVFTRCADDPHCASRFPAIGERTLGWLEELERTPLEVGHEDFASGEWRETRFGAAELAAVLRLMLYDARTASLLPSMLDAALADGHVAPLVRQSRMQSESLGRTLASGMHHAIVCTEDVPRIDADAAARSVDTWLGAALLESLSASCADWPTGIIDEDFAEPLRVDVPTLLLSGEADPITPPAYGERVLEMLPRAHHIVLRGQGHTQAPLGCVPRLMARFVESADPLAPELDCLDRLDPAPFFVDANGPRP